MVEQLYGDVESVEERHRHRYEVNPKYVANLEAAGMKFVGKDDDGVRMEIMELEGHKYFVATQYHPEYLSRPLKPSPPFLGLILASINKLDSYLETRKSSPLVEQNETESGEKTKNNLNQF